MSVFYLSKGYPTSLPVLLERGAISMEASVFQLIPSMAGPRAEMRMGWGQDTKQPDIVPDTTRILGEAQRGLGRAVSSQTTGQREEGNLTYFIFTKEYFFSPDEREEEKEGQKVEGGGATTALFFFHN